MGRERIFTVLTGAVLAFAVSFGCAGCVMSAYFYPGSLPGGATPVCSLAAVALWCGGISLAMALCSAGRKGYFLWAILLPLAALLWWKGGLSQSTEALCRLISKALNVPYRTGILSWSDRQVTDCTMALCALCTVPALVTAWTVSRPARAMWAVLAVLLPMSLCMLLVDRVPDSGWLMLVLLGLLVLLLTGAVRRQNRQQGNILGLIVLVPCALAVLALFLLVPRQGYDKAALAAQLQQTIVGWFTPHTVITQPPTETIPMERPTIPILREQVDLAHLHAQNDRPWVVMTVKAEKSGTYYLRGQAFDVYTGESWGIRQENTDLPWLPAEACEPWGTVTVHTEEQEPLCYVPYYTPELGGTALPNSENRTQYAYICSRLPSEPAGHLYGTRQDMEALTQLPESTRQWAEKLLRSLPDSNPESIRNYVRNSAEYDRNPLRMPSNDVDFVRWFLTEADRGYCVHFASSAVVLLRAAGYPARYVTGYTARVGSDGPAQVQAKQAHAWAEYWTPEAGWQILEATPGQRQPELQETEPPTTQAPTEPEITEPVTTAPTEPDRPATQLPTVPTDTQPLPEAEKPSGLPNLLIWLAAAAAVIGGAVLQRVLRLQAGKRAISRGEPNERALTAWKQLEKLARFSGQEPEQQVLQLAQKAQFSNHTLTPEELHRFDRERYRQLAFLRKQSWIRRVFYRWVLCLY